MTNQTEQPHNLALDQAHPDQIDARVRASASLSATNLWVLMCAIAIASIGLNVNSTAVIIGAMLISPLMGPIVGLGYGTAVSDFSLIKLSFRNMLIFIVISLITSTLYFILSPLNEAQSELLARTQPTLWDVLIAFFGGVAGMLATTRKEGSNVIPGVAIATALMPPLCTVGFGLAHQHWDFVIGAFYLFAINCVFIAFASLLFSKILKLPRRGLVTPSKLRLHRIVILSILLLVMLPSGYSAMQMAQKEFFTKMVNQVIHQLEQEQELFVLQQQFNHQNKSLKLIINGQGNGQNLQAIVQEKLIKAGISSPQVHVIFAGGNEELEIVKEALASGQNQYIDLQTQIQRQQKYLEKIMNDEKTPKFDVKNIIKEIQIQYPQAQTIHFSHGTLYQKNNDNYQDNAIFVALTVDEPLTANEQNKLNNWLIQRLNHPNVELFVRIIDNKPKIDD